METRSLRLFFGLSLPPELREGLDQWRRNYPGIEGWSKGEGLHLTLAFLGQRPASRLPQLATLAASVAGGHESFTLCTAALGTFSRPGSTRLLWLGLEPSSGLTALARDLRGTLLEAEETLDAKPFHPHVTLARFRQPRPLDGFAPPPAWPFSVERLTLFESRSQGGYTALQSWLLQRV